jgi:hypothetical protein
MRGFVSVFLTPMLLLLLFAQPATPALAQVKEGAESRNVLIKVSLDREDPTGTKSSRSIQTVVRIDGARGHVTDGVRFAIAGQGEAGKSYSYETVGLSLNVEARSAEGRAVLLRGLVEDTSLQGGTPALPSFRSWSHELGDIVVKEGKPLEASALKAADGTWTKLVVEVDIQDQ